MTPTKMYCSKYKKHVPVENGHFVPMGKPTRIEGKCVYCKTPVSRVIKK